VPCLRFPMKFPKLIFVLTVLLTAAAFAGEAPRAAPGILPHQFAGWEIAGSPHASKDPALADHVNAALLKEYGFTDFEYAAYTHDNRKLTVKAARFADTSGAYGAFTYYKMPQMLNEKIGDQGASLNKRVVFYRGSILVDAVFEKLTAMSAADLREVAGVLDDLDVYGRNAGSEHVQIRCGLAPAHRSALAVFVAVGRLNGHDRHTQVGQGGCEAADIVAQHIH